MIYIRGIGDFKKINTLSQIRSQQVSPKPRNLNPIEVNMQKTVLEDNKFKMKSYEVSSKPSNKIVNQIITIQQIKASRNESKQKVTLNESSSK